MLRAARAVTWARADPHFITPHQNAVLNGDVIVPKCFELARL